MSHLYASQTPAKYPSTQHCGSQHMSRRAQYRAKQTQSKKTKVRLTQAKQTGSKTNRVSAMHVPAAYTQLSNTRLSASTQQRGQVDRRGSGPLNLAFFTPHRRKLLGAGGAITVLAMATILPTQVSSQAIVDSNCEQVIKSGAEVSRGQLSGLLEMPIRSTQEAVRQVMAEPYCTLPALTPTETTNAGADTKTSAEKTIEREAYPLAFDPEAWVVLNYSGGEYQGYDFVFKP